jgi:hypothetical protein
MQMDEKVATIAMSNAMINTGLFTRRAYEIMAPAIKAAIDNPDEGKATPSELEKYVGAYDGYPWGGETHVVPWKGGLALVAFPTEDPLDRLTRLKHIEGHTFRRILDDDELGREVSFELDDQGQVVRLWNPTNFLERIR